MRDYCSIMIQVLVAHRIMTVSHREEPQCLPRGSSVSILGVIAMLNPRSALLCVLRSGTDLE